RRAPHEVPGVVGQLHLHQHVAREELLLGLTLLLVAHLDDFLRGHQHARDLLAHAEDLGARLDRLRHLVLETRVGVDDEPLPVRALRVHERRRFTAHRRILSTTFDSAMSTPPRKNASTTVTTITIVVELMSSSRLGQVTLRNSARTSCANSLIRVTAPIVSRPLARSGRAGGSSHPLPRIWSPVL